MHNGKIKKITSIDQALRKIETDIDERKRQLEFFSHKHKEKSGNLSETMSGHIKDYVRGSWGQMEDNVDEAKKMAVAALNFLTEEIEKDPWKVVGGVAVGALVAGRILASYLKRGVKL